MRLFFLSLVLIFSSWQHGSSEKKMWPPKNDSELFIVELPENQGEHIERDR